MPSTESSAWQYVTLDPNFLKQAPLILQQHKGITSLSGGMGPAGAYKKRSNLFHKKNYVQNNDITKDVIH